jgi:hypothetical protein
VSSLPDVVKRYGRIQLMASPSSSDSYEVVLVDAAHPNTHMLVGSISREASTLPDIIRLLRSAVGSSRTSHAELTRRIEAASDANEREHLEYHLRYDEWCSSQVAAALQESETRHAVNGDDEY